MQKFFSKFLITVRKTEDNEEYAPNSLKAFFVSFDRNLEEKTGGLCLMKDVHFGQTRRAFHSKQSRGGSRGRVQGVRNPLR